MISRKWLQHWWYLKWRLSPTYHRTLRDLQARETWPRSAWDEWQFATLRNVLVHAATRVPYYRETFARGGLDPRRLTHPADFLVYPQLDKGTFRDTPAAFLADNARPERLIKAFTGGTTGTPVPLYREPRDLARERAYAVYVYRMLGIEPFCRTAYIRGPADDHKGRYHYYTDFGRSLRLSSHNLSDENLSRYVTLMRRFRPKMIWATPSVTTLLCRFIDREKLGPIPSLKWAFTPSETLYDFQRERIEQTLQCRVCTSYGHSEHVVAAGKCSHSDLYHVLPQYGYTELLRDDGTPVTEDGEEGDIVGTSFTNPSCPLIRYRTGDRAVFSTRRCSCGRPFPMWERVLGREKAIAYARQGAAVSVGPELLCTVFDHTYAMIRQFGLEQHRIGELHVLVIPYRQADMPAIEAFFHQAFRERFPDCFTVVVEPVRELALTGSGKHLFFRQHLESP